MNKFIAERARSLGSRGPMNHLFVSTCEAIKALALKGWSGRRIARELAVNRETVARYLGPSKPGHSAPRLRGHRHGLSTRTSHSAPRLPLWSPQSLRGSTDRVWGVGWLFKIGMGRRNKLVRFPTHRRFP